MINTVGKIKDHVSDKGWYCYQGDCEPAILVHIFTEHISEDNPTFHGVRNIAISVKMELIPINKTG